MAGSKSNWLEDLVLDSVLGKSSTNLSTAAVPGTVYVVLYNSTVNDTWTSTSTGQCAGSTYTRSMGSVTNSSANWTNSTAGSKQNKTVIQFTTSAGSDWGTIQSFAILTSTSTVAGGDGSTNSVLYWGDLTSSQVISAGNTVQFSTGAIVITED